MKKRIAFIKFGGLASGGTEKHLQTLAVNLPKDKFEVTYFYCDSAPYIGSDFEHLSTDPFRLKYMQDSSVRLVKFNVGAKDVTTKTHDWVNHDFWQHFNENDFDIVQTGRSGHAEYPFTLINKVPIIDSLHLPEHAENKHNVRKTVLVSHEQKEIWASLGGDKSRCIVIPNAIDMPSVESDLRKDLDISKDAVVIGMHQRPDDGIFSPTLMESYVKTMKDDLHLLVLGGSGIYKQHAKHLQIPNSRITFLPPVGDVNYIHKFLNTLDFYTHARIDGEQCSTALMEAMFHGLPIISHKAPSMGQADQIGGSGFICTSCDEYAHWISQLYENCSISVAGAPPIGLRTYLSILAKKRYDEKYSLNSVVDSYVEIYDTIS